MKRIVFKSELKLNSKGAELFSLPILGNFRVSCWFKNSTHSYPSEISCSSLIDVGTVNSVIVQVANTVPLDELREGNTYYIGLFSNLIIGEGVIKELID